MVGKTGRNSDVSNMMLTTILAGGNEILVTRVVTLICAKYIAVSTLVLKVSLETLLSLTIEVIPHITLVRSTRSISAIDRKV